MTITRPVPAALNTRFDELEAQLSRQYEMIELPLHHLFTPGLYVRECFIPAGTFCTTKIHLSEHPFVISMGRVSVWSGVKGENPQLLGAPYTSVTKPGTRRMIYAHEDTIWSTFHPTNKTDVAEIEKDLILAHQEHLYFSVSAYGEILEKMRSLE